jgi:regulator of sirC expression with transglutaminase-like and TPR domain
VKALEERKLDVEKERDAAKNAVSRLERELKALQAKKLEVHILSETF